MKISYRTHPALAFLEKSSKEGVTLKFDEKDKADWKMLESFFIPQFIEFTKDVDSKNVIKPSKSFSDAAWEYGKKAGLDSLLDMAKEIVGQSGAILMDDRTTFFKVKLSPKNIIIVEFISCSNDENMLIEFMIQNGETANKQSFWCSQCVIKDDLPVVLRNGIGSLAF